MKKLMKERPIKNPSFETLVAGFIERFNRRDAPLEEAESIMEQAGNYMLPKKTKVLGTAFVKNFTNTKDDTTLILKTNLFFENLVQEIIKKKFNSSEELLRKVANNNYKQIILLQTQQHLSKEIAEDLLVVNGLRNKIAHNLNYDFSKFDISHFSKIKKQKIKVFGKEKKRIFNRMVFKFYVWILWTELHKQHRFLHLLDLPK